MRVGKRKTVNTPLAAWLNANGMTMREFGRRIGIPHSRLSGIVDGKAMPGLIVAYECERLTQGEVPMESWLGMGWARKKMTELRAGQPEEYQPESFRKKDTDNGASDDQRNADDEEEEAANPEGDGGPDAEGDDAFPEE